MLKTKQKKQRKSWKTRIDAGSVLKKTASQEVDDEVKARAQIAKESIFGKRNKFS